jgi:surfeit locus 1 family protein
MTTLPAPPTRRWPIIPTLLVAVAVATMIALGFWQIRRAQEKDALIATYAANANRPATAFPLSPVADPRDYLFRRASANCLRVTTWQAVAGRNADDNPGTVHIAQCARGAEGPGFAVVTGWSETPAQPEWAGGPVSGRIGAGAANTMRLVSDRGLAGMAAPAPPSMDAIPQNHRSYAVQWFLFALAAAVIYIVAVRQRWRAALPPENAS